MAKSSLPLTVLAGALVLAAGCGGDDSIASQSARAFREAQQRGETPGGDGHAHGHGALSPDTPDTPDTPGTPGTPGMPSPIEGTGAGTMHHDGAGGAHPGDQPMGHAAMGHGADGATHSGQPMDHTAMGHGASRQPGGAGSSDHASTGHGTGGTAGGGQAVDHAAMGHDTPGGATAEPQPMDHAEMGHAGRPTPSAIQAGTASGPAPPVPASAAASTLAPDPLDAPAATSVSEARRSAAVASEMAGSGSGHEGHGGHGATGTYRHVDAGRGPEASGSPPGEAGPGAADHGGHGAHDGSGSASAAPVYTCPMHPEVHRGEPGTCPICGMELEGRSE
jgi:hypothetical protein